MAYRKKLRGPLESYEDPILLNELKRKMQDRVAKARDEGLNVTHDYMTPREYRKMFGKQTSRARQTSPGEWNAVTDYKAVPGLDNVYDVRRQTINVPMTPSLSNAWALGEEYAHAKAANKDNQHYNTLMESMRGDNTYLEELRAKKAADEFIGGYHTPRSQKWADYTRDSYKNNMLKQGQNVTAEQAAKAEAQGIRDAAAYAGNHNPESGGGK